jgi:transcriptional regulator with XRE-family HTH domain
MISNKLKSARLAKELTQSEVAKNYTLLDKLFLDGSKVKRCLIFM